MPVIGKPTALPRKSNTHNDCGSRIRTAAAEANSAFSYQIATSVMSSAVSQKYRKLVGP